VTLTLAEAVKQHGRTIPLGAEDQGLLYQPVLLAQAQVQFSNRKYNLRHQTQITAVVEEPDRLGHVRWPEFLVEDIADRAFAREPASPSRFAALQPPFTDERTLKTMHTDFADWIYRDLTAPVKANETLRVYAGPEIDEETFLKMCADAAEEKEDVEIDRLDSRYKRKIESVQKKLTREQRELREDQADLERSKSEEYTSYAETALGFFGLGRRRSVSAAMSKRSKTARAQEDVQESIEEIAELEGDLAELKEELAAELQEIEEKWADIAADVIEIPVSPYKKDIDVRRFGVAWVPYYLVQLDDDFQTVPAFQLGTQ
jgi:hypothetical protein